MELYYVLAITDRDKSERMFSLYRDAGLRMCMMSLARGTATDEHLSLHDLEATEKAAISGIAGAEEAKTLLKNARRKLFIDIPGNGILLTVPLKSVAGGKTLAYLGNNAEKGGRPPMNFEHELIIVILNEGHVDVVMDAARPAGAGGGTVLHAKGTGGIGTERFFGVSLAEEKDMVYIVAHSDEKAAIMRAVTEKAGPGTPSGAICFSLPISSVAGLRARDD